ncbi:DUF6691 family protein [Stappia sp. TSB10P1A]|uniref:DUF6691 family protein n=1 Tax=Stappia sp. TSB10P1A TaxID=2003585 RepID=UPI001643B560|nr:DUF6691 family protein [Stappia sp. TSB10P1A]
MTRILPAFLIGLLFGTGILLSGMANPAKVLNFFDIAGTFDPSLAFVMGAALIVTVIGYRLVMARPAPVLAAGFSLPGTTRLDLRLIGGSALFGIGWGLAGFCPGGVVPALGLGRSEPFVFAGAMVAAIAAIRLVEAWRVRQPQTA